MNLLIKRQKTGQPLVQLPSGALEYVGFSAYRLHAGETLPVTAGQQELCLVLLSGRANVSGEAPGQGVFQWEGIGALAAHTAFHALRGNQPRPKPGRAGTGGGADGDMDLVKRVHLRLTAGG